MHPCRLHDHLLRTVEEAQGKVAIAAVCLLQCARHGLSEVELLEMLGTLFEHGEQAAKIGGAIGEGCLSMRAQWEMNSGGS